MVERRNFLNQCGDLGGCASVNGSRKQVGSSSPVQFLVTIVVVVVVATVAASVIVQALMLVVT